MKVRYVCMYGWMVRYKEQLEEVNSAPVPRSAGRAMVLRNGTISTIVAGRS